MPPVDTKWFKFRLIELDKSQRSLAKFMDVEPSSLSLMIHGKRVVSVQEAAKIARFLNQPYEEVSRRLGADVP